MNDNNKPCKGVLQFSGEALIRKKDGQLVWVGMPFDPRAKAVCEINAGHCGQAQIDALDGVPVFDEDTLDPDGDSVLFIMPCVGRKR